MTPRRVATRTQALPWPNANPVAPGWRPSRGEARAQGAVPHREPRVTCWTAKAAEAESGHVQPAGPPRSPATRFRPGRPRAPAPVSVQRWRRARARERTPTRPPGWAPSRRRTADRTTRPASSDARVAIGVVDTRPGAPVVRLSVESCMTTGAPSALRRTSNSTHEAPSWAARRRLASVFSGARPAAPR